MDIQKTSVRLVKFLSVICLAFTICNHVLGFWEHSRLIQTALLGGLVLAITVLAYLLKRFWLAQPPGGFHFTWVIAAALLAALIAATLARPLPAVTKPRTLTITASGAGNPRAQGVQVTLLELKVAGKKIPLKALRGADWQFTPDGLTSLAPSSLEYAFTGSDGDEVTAVFHEGPAAGIVYLSLGNPTQPVDLFALHMGDRVVSLPLTSPETTLWGAALCAGDVFALSALVLLLLALLPKSLTRWLQLDIARPPLSQQLLTPQITDTGKDNPQPLLTSADRYFLPGALMVVVLVYLPCLLLPYARSDDTYMLSNFNTFPGFDWNIGRPIWWLGRAFIGQWYPYLGMQLSVIYRSVMLLFALASCAALYLWTRRFGFSHILAVTVVVGFATLPAFQIAVSIWSLFLVGYFIAILSGWALYSACQTARLHNGKLLAGSLGILFCLGFYQNSALFPLVMFTVPVLTAAAQDFTALKNRTQTITRAVLSILAITIFYYVVWRIGCPLQYGDKCFSQSSYAPNSVFNDFWGNLLISANRFALMLNLWNPSVNWSFWTVFFSLFILAGVCADGILSRRLFSRNTRLFGWIALKYGVALGLILGSQAIMFVVPLLKYASWINAPAGVMFLFVSSIAMLAGFLQARLHANAAKAFTNAISTLLLLAVSIAAASNTLLSVVLPAHLEYLFTLNEIRQSTRQEAQVDFVEVRLTDPSRIYQRPSTTLEFGFSNQTPQYAYYMVRSALIELGLSAEVDMEVLQGAGSTYFYSPARRGAILNSATARHKIVIDYTKYDFNWNPGARPKAP